MPGQGSEGQGPSLRDKHNGLCSGREEAKSRLGGLLPSHPAGLPTVQGQEQSPPTTWGCRGILRNIHVGATGGRRARAQDCSGPDPQNPHHSSNYELFPLETKEVPTTQHPN